jgi:negative regulator of sigma E activity
MDRCNAFQNQLSEFIDGEITADEAAASLLHAGGCHRCRTFLSSVLMARSAATRAFSVKVPKRLDDRIHSIPGRTKGDTAVAKAPFWKRRLALSYPIVVLASLLLISLGAWITVRSIQSKNAAFPVILENAELQVLPTVEVRAMAAKDVK